MIVSMALVAAADQLSTKVLTGVLARSGVTPLMTSWNPTGSSSLQGWTIEIGPCSLRGGRATMRLHFIRW